MKVLVAIGFVFATFLGVSPQGYFVPNGVVTNVYPGEISVMHDPINLRYTGFELRPVNTTQPTVYTNTFLFNPVIDVSVRVFLVSVGDPITEQAIQSGSYTELMFQNYVFDHASPFYVGLYTGNQNFYPPDGIYSDPLFGWARLVNNQGVIELLDSALAYRAQGILVGTQRIIPEPSTFSLGRTRRLAARIASRTKPARKAVKRLARPLA